MAEAAEGHGGEGQPAGEVDAEAGLQAWSRVWRVWQTLGLAPRVAGVQPVDDADVAQVTTEQMLPTQEGALVPTAGPQASVPSPSPPRRATITVVKNFNVPTKM